MSACFIKGLPRYAALANKTVYQKSYIICKCGPQCATHVIQRHIHNSGIHYFQQGTKDSSDGNNHPPASIFHQRFHLLHNQFPLEGILNFYFFTWVVRGAELRSPVHLHWRRIYPQHSWWTLVHHIFINLLFHAHKKHHFKKSLL